MTEAKLRVTGKASKAEQEKLVTTEVDDSLKVDELLRQAQALTNKRIHRITEPHLRPHQVKGRTYYYYCRGTDKEIYLGTADHILEAVLRYAK